MSNKAVNSDFYISFENGLINVIQPDKTKDIYIKLFPTANDKFDNPKEISGSGSGFAISSDGYIITNHHVTKGATSIKVRGIHGDFTKKYSAKVILEDKNNDLSIIKIDDPNFISLGTIPYVILNKSSDVGSTVFVLGYPLRASMGEEVKLTNGIISSKSGYQGDATSYQITVPIQPGNSGGPLFNKNGNIIGIVNAKLTGAENASYAIKSSYILNLIDLLSVPPQLQIKKFIGWSIIA
jgi:S1-C subfamily serine protease